MMYVLGILGVLLLICVFPRQMLVLIGICLFLALIGVGYWYIEDRSSKRAQDSVIVSVMHSTSGECDSDYPIRVSIINLSDKIIERVQWQFAAYRPGYSRNLVQGYNFIHSYKILLPGEAVALCYSIPEVGGSDLSPSRLEWGVKAKWVAFKD